MSSFNPLLTVKFDEDPMGKYHEMKIAMETLAGTLGCDLYDTGLAGKGIHLSDMEYLRHFGDDERPKRQTNTTATDSHEDGTVCIAKQKKIIQSISQVCNYIKLIWSMHANPRS